MRGNHTLQGSLDFSEPPSISERAVKTCSIEGCTRKHFGAGLCNAHYLRKRKWGDPNIKKCNANGEGGYNPLGYMRVSIDGVRIFEHVAIAEKALGRKLPRGVIVHHIDENPSNNSRGNLIILPNQAYHRRLHQRMNAFKATGDKDKRPCCFCHEYDDVCNLTKNGTSYRHKKCATDDAKRRRHLLNSK